MRRRSRQDDQGLEVHQHDPARVGDTLVVFIHGLNGRATGTWGNFPEFLESDPAFPADYTFFDYLSLSRRISKNAPSLVEVIRYLISQIRATPYRQVVFVGHSLGGNIARAAVKYIHDISLQNNRDYIRVQGLLLFASPLLGSSWYPNQLTKDGRFLAAYSDELSDIMRFFHNRVDTTLGAPRTDRINIPTFAAIALRDRLVRRMSSQELIPEAQTQRIDANHRQIVKPKSRNSVSYTCLVDWVNKCMARRPTRIRFAEFDMNQIIARYTCSSRHAEWQDKYLAACAAVERSDGVGIIDTTDGDESVNLSICVVEDQEIIRGSYNQRIQHEALAQTRDHSMSLYISAIGAAHSVATNQAEKLVQEAKAGTARYFIGLPDASTLEDTISTWLRSAYARKRQSLFGRPPFSIGDRFDFPR